MKILITGNMGYIGPVVVQHFRQKYPDAVLVGFDVGYFGACLTNSGLMPERWLDAQYYGDIRKFPYGLLKDVDAVVHLAAISNDPIGNAFEKLTYDINYNSTIRLALNAKNAGVKAFVFFSSCSIYGATEHESSNEQSELNPLTAYAKSKVQSENGLKELATDGFTVTSLRFSTACGISDRLRLDLVLNDFVACAMSSREITVLSDGTPWRPLINVKDMALAAEWAIGRYASDGPPFLAVNIGRDDWNYQVKDLAEAVAHIIPDVSVSINKSAPPDKRSYRVSFDLYKKLAPDHQPRADLRVSIIELKEGLRKIGFVNPDFRDSKFIRLVHLMELQKNKYLNHRLEWTTPPGLFE